MIHFSHCMNNVAPVNSLVALIGNCLLTHIYSTTLTTQLFLMIWMDLNLLQA